MSNYLIIRDLPKATVSMDLIYHETDENFIGFKRLHTGIHHFAVKLKSGKFIGFWFFVEGGDPLETIFDNSSSTVIVKRYDASTDTVVDDTAENIRKYTNLVLSGEFDNGLLKARVKNRIPSWNNLSSYIKRFGEVPSLKHSEDEGQSFSELFNDIHGGNLYSLFAEFQFCFLRMLAGADEGYEQEAMRRWAQMMRFICRATLEEVNYYKQFYLEWLAVLIHQLQCLSTSVFQSDDDNLLHLVIFSNTANLLEVIEQSDNDELKKDGREYEEYLKERAAGLV